MFTPERKQLFATAGSLGLLLVACLMLFFANLQRGDLWAESEGNYAEIPREMLETGDWVIPHLNYVPYLEKPPLFYWLTAWTYRTWGASVFTARLWSAFPALLLVLSVFAFLSCVRHPRDGLICALILATCIGMIAMARISYMDMLLCFFTAWVFLAFYLGDCAVKSPEKKFWFLIASFALALAVLTKGLIGIVLPFLGLGLYVTCQRRWSAMKDLPWFPGVILFLIIVAPWHVAAALKNGRFAWFYFINEHWLRFLGQRLPKDYYQGPIYYHLLRTFFLSLPWSVFLPLLFIRSKAPRPGGGLNRFLVSWFMAFLIFYTLSKAKANYYMMGAMPALAMLLGLKLNAMVSERRTNLIWLAGTGLLLITAIVLYGVLALWPYSILKKLAPGCYPLLLSATGGLCVFLLASLLSAWRGRWYVSFSFFSAGMVFAAFLVFSQGQIFDRRGSVLPLVEIIRANEDPDTLVVLRGTFEKNSQLAFYRKKGFVIVSDQGDVGGDLDFGARFPEHKNRFMQWADFLKRFGGPEKILYITWREADCAELQGNHPAKYHLIGRVAYRSVVANFPPKTFR